MKADRLYSSVRDCLTQARQRFGGVTVGYQMALASQIPHSIILFSSFEYFNWQLADDDDSFTKYDDYTFAYKFL